MMDQLIHFLPKLMSQVSFIIYAIWNFEDEKFAS